MSLWYGYVLAVSALCFAGYLRLDILLTLLLAGLVHAGLQFFPSQRRLLTALKALLAAALALALLWKQSFLPPASTLLSFLVDPATRPTTQYMAGFARQFLNPWMIAAAAVIYAAVFLVSIKSTMRLAFSVYLVLVAAWIMQPKRGVSMGAETPEAFYKNESGRFVEFPGPGGKAASFDVIFLHICSLSWKDIRDSGAEVLPFLSKFDYVFTDFSTATSYSRLAGIRLLKSACGQIPPSSVFAESPAGCYLMDGLRGSGYKTFTMLNHDGKYDDYAGEIQKVGHADAPLGVGGLPAEYRMFDGTVLHSDRAALAKYWQARQASKAERAAVYYNTINLHVGTYEAGGPWKPDSAAAYGKRLTAMAAQFEEFFATVERSGRNAVVVLVPEHGAALTGNKMQARDVREIPLPPVVMAPAAVKLVGKAFYPAAGPQVVTKPASLQALAWLTAEFLRNDPFTQAALKPADIASRIPSTAFLADNYETAVMRKGDGYVYRMKGADWAPLPSFAGIPPGTIPFPGDFKRAE